MSEPVLQDIRLVLLARKDPAVVDLVLQRVHPRVCQVVRSAVGKEQEAEDLIQTCLVEIMKSLSGFRGTGSLESWAGQVAYKVIMRQLKRKRRSERTVSPVPHEIGVSPRNPEQEAARKRIWRRLAKCIETIPTRRRMTLLLRLMHEYSIAEVAELTGVSANTVKDRLRTGMRELRVAFTEDAVLQEMMRETTDE